MTTFANVLGTASPLPQTAFNPIPILGASALAPLGAPNEGILPQAANNPKPIIGASVVAILFPSGGGGSYGGPV